MTNARELRQELGELESLKKLMEKRIQRVRQQLIELNGGRKVPAGPLVSHLIQAIDSGHTLADLERQLGVGEKTLRKIVNDDGSLRVNENTADSILSGLGLPHRFSMYYPVVEDSDEG